jgi:hypothetical protein
MNLAMLRRLAKATFIQGQRSFVIHNGVDDLPRAEDDASRAVPQRGTNSAEATKAEVVAAPGLAPARKRATQ